MITYENFINKLNAKLSDNITLYYELLLKIIKSPNRFIGDFRITNTKTKLIQYVTQSREILFGNFMEDIISEYLSVMGYKNMDKYIGLSLENKPLMADQLCINGDIIYFIEQKMRDDHDSTKKRGQFINFQEKITLLYDNFPDKQIISIMWFIDSGFKKNKNYYKNKINSIKFNNVYLLYGQELFTEIFKREDVWNEITSYLKQNSQERSNEVLQIPDLDTSNEFLEVLEHLFKQNKKLYNKLTNSKNYQYAELRNRLFPQNYNFNRIKNKINDL